jgi:hypothetical protein
VIIICLVAVLAVLLFQSAVLLAIFSSVHRDDSEQPVMSGIDEKALFSRLEKELDRHGKDIKEADNRSQIASNDALEAFKKMSNLETRINKLERTVEREKVNNDE